MSGLGSSLYPQTLRSIASASVSGTYAIIGTALTFPARIIKITNNSTQDVTVSWDGINDHEYVPAGSFILLDISSNKETSQICEIAAGTAFLVKGTAGTGNVYLSSYYART
jgi:hypothetical protein